MTTPNPGPLRPTARVLLLTPNRQVLLVHATDPATGLRWWELPGGGREDGETLQQAACRELAEETGILLRPDELEHVLWTRVVRRRLRPNAPSAHETVYLRRTTSIELPSIPQPRAGDGVLLGSRWWHPDELSCCAEPVVPDDLLQLIAAIPNADPDVARDRQRYG